MSDTNPDLFDDVISYAGKCRNRERAEFILIRHELELKILKENVTRYKRYIDASLLIGIEPKTFNEYINTHDNKTDIEI